MWFSDLSPWLSRGQSAVVILACNAMQGCLETYFRIITEFGQPMWRAEAHTALSALPATASGDESSSSNVTS